MIRVLHVIAQLGVGGCERQLLGVCQRIDRTRYDVGICYYTGNADGMVDEFRAAGVRVQYVDRRAGMSRLAFLRQLRRAIAEFSPDVVHCWLYSANYWGRLAGAGLARTAFVASTRSMGTVYGPTARLLERLLFRRSRWMANSHRLKQHLESSLGLPAERVYSMWNAVEPFNRNRSIDRLAVRRELNVPERTAIVLNVGRLTAAKNHEMLFRVAARVTALHPDVLFVCAGHGEREQELLALRDRMNLGDRVRMLGLRRDVSRLLAAADVFCFTSLYEGFPNALAEAMAAAVPVVTTAFEGADEIVRQGETGVVVPLDEDITMASAIDALLMDGTRARRLGESAQSWVEQNLSWPRLLDELDNLYRQAIPQGRSVRTSLRTDGEPSATGRS